MPLHKNRYPRRSSCSQSALDRTPRWQTNCKLDLESRSNRSAMTSPHVLRLQASEDTTTKSWRFKSGLLHCFSPFVTFVRQCGNSRDQCGRTAAHRPTHFCKNAGPTILPEANLVPPTEGVASCGEGAGWSAPYARHNKKMVVGLVPPFDHCAETDFVQRIASPGDSSRKSIHHHADKKTNRRERNTIRTEHRRATHNKREGPSWEAKASTPETPEMAAWRSRCAEHSTSKRLAWVPARNSAKADWDSPAAKMRSNKTLCDTKRQTVQISPAPLPAHVRGLLAAP